jgi:3-hydroxybutyryl-CoA dehydratase
MILRRVQLTQNHFDRFARLSGDHNPIHVDPAFAARTRFGRTLCHGMFLWSLLSELVHEHFGALPIAHHLTFPGPAYAGDTLLLSLEARGEHEVRGLITRDDGTPSCEALVLLP